MPKPATQARHQRPSGKPRLRQRRGQSTDQMLLDLHDRLLASVDKAEHEILRNAHHYPLALLANPRPTRPSPIPRR